jgi:cbb3-type cytochrome oxidase subunit 3
MKLSDVVGHAGLAFYAEVALVLFGIVFIAVVARLLLTRHAPEWEAMGRLPLDDDPRSSNPGDPS